MQSSRLPFLGIVIIIPSFQSIGTFLYSQTWLHNFLVSWSFLFLCFWAVQLVFHQFLVLRHSSFSWLHGTPLLGWISPSLIFNSSPWRSPKSWILSGSGQLRMAWKCTFHLFDCSSNDFNGFPSTSLMGIFCVNFLDNSLSSKQNRSFVFSFFSFVMFKIVCFILFAEDFNLLSLLLLTYSDQNQCLLLPYSDQNQCLLLTYSDQNQCLLLPYSDQNQCLLLPYSDQNQCLWHIVIRTNVCYWHIVSRTNVCYWYVVIRTNVCYWYIVIRTNVCSSVNSHILEWWWPSSLITYVIYLVYSF